MKEISRRTVLGGLPTALSIAALGAAATAAPQPAGKLKITKLNYYKATLTYDMLFIEMHTDGGIVGIGEGTCHGRCDVVEAAIRWLEPYLIGYDPSGVEENWNRLLYGYTRWSSGIIPRTALSAIDMALWDIMGKRLGMPVWRLMGGGSLQKPLRAYYTHWNSGLRNDPAAYAERAIETVKNGWTAVKFSPPAGGTESDRMANLTAILAAMRKAVGAKLDIGLEFSESLNKRTAVSMARAVEPYSPFFIEEPLPRENLPEFSELAAKTSVPIATGEGQLSRYEFRPLLETNGVAIVQPDVAKCGGITEIRKIANFAEVYGVQVAPHQCYGPIAHVASLASMAACRNFLIQEWEGVNDEAFQRVCKGTYPVQKNGVITLPERAGLGIEVDFAEFEKRHPFTNLGSKAKIRS